MIDPPATRSSLAADIGALRTRSPRIIVGFIGTGQPETPTPSRPRVLPGWWVDVTLVAALVALTGALATGHLLGVDNWVADWALAHQWSPLYWFCRVLDYLGQGGQVLMPISGILAAVLAWRTHSVRPVLPIIAGFILTYLTIGPIKIWSHRATPRFHGKDHAVFFNPHPPIDTAMQSYPSGHMGNSVVWYGVIALLLTALLHRRLTRWETFLVRVLPALILFVSMCYTGFHWVTDSVAGVLLGLFLIRLMARIPWDSVKLPALRGWGGPAGLSPSDRSPG